MNPLRTFKEINSNSRRVFFGIVVGLRKTELELGSRLAF